MPEHGEAMSVGERITEAISIHTVFSLRLCGLEIPISDTVIMSWIIMALLIIMAFLGTRRLSLIPGRFQAALEAMVDFGERFMGEKLGHHGKAFLPYVGTVFLFLCAANLLPMLTPIGGFGYEPAFTIKPAARDINIAAALAVLTMGVVIASSIRVKGLSGFLGKLVQPLPLMLPFNLIDYAVKPLSLSLRLFGNILGAFIIMRLVEIVMPVGLPPLVGLYFDLIDGLIQAVVFSFLATIYIEEALE